MPEERFSKNVAHRDLANIRAQTEERKRYQDGMGAYFGGQLDLIDRLVSEWNLNGDRKRDRKGPKPAAGRYDGR